MTVRSAAPAPGPPWAQKPAACRRAACPPGPAARSRSRRTAAGDSMAITPITAVHTPSRSAAEAASRDSSTASAAPGGYGGSSPVLPVPGILDGQRPQLRQVRRVPQVLPGDHRRSLIQRQRQVPQFGGHRGGAGFVGQARPPVQQGQRLLRAEHVYRDTCPQLGRRLPATVISTRAAPVAGTNGRSRPASRAPSNTSRQRLPSASSQCRTAWPASSPPRPGTPLGQPGGFGHRGQPGHQALTVPGVDPRDQPPAAASLARAHAAASSVLPAPAAPVSTTARDPWLARFSCARRAGLGCRPGRCAGIFTDDDPIFRCCSAAGRRGLRLPGSSRRLTNDHGIHSQPLKGFQALRR